MANHRKLTAARLLAATLPCPDDGHELVPTGDAYSSDTTSENPFWAVAFRCPLHPDETVRLWRPELQPLLDDALAGVDVASLPVVGPNLRPI